MNIGSTEQLLIRFQNISYVKHILDDNFHLKGVRDFDCTNYFYSHLKKTPGAPLIGWYSFASIKVYNMAFQLSYLSVYICLNFMKRYLQKFQVRFNNLTLVVNKKQLRVAS